MRLTMKNPRLRLAAIRSNQSPNTRQGTMILKDKTAVISGAASRRGIGLATARLFAGQGARVAILDIDAQAAADAAAELGAVHRGIGCDVTDRASCQAAIDAVLADFGAIDILVNNAGI